MEIMYSGKFSGANGLKRDSPGKTRIALGVRKQFQRKRGRETRRKKNVKYIQLCKKM